MFRRKTGRAVSAERKLTEVFVVVVVHCSEEPPFGIVFRLVGCPGIAFYRPAQFAVAEIREHLGARRNDVFTCLVIVLMSKKESNVMVAKRAHIICQLLEIGSIVAIVALAYISLRISCGSPTVKRLSGVGVPVFVVVYGSVERQGKPFDKIGGNVNIPVQIKRICILLTGLQLVILKRVLG